MVVMRWLWSGELFAGSFSKSVVKSFMALMAAAVLAGCTIGSPGSDVAQKAADNFYQAQQQGDLETALGFYSDKRTPEEWRAYLEHIQNELGTVKDYSLKHTEVNTVLSGRFYIFDYQVNYSSGKGARETLTLFDSVEADDKPLIVSHMILADGFKPLF